VIICLHFYFGGRCLNTQNTPTPATYGLVQNEEIRHVWQRPEVIAVTAAAVVGGCWIHTSCIAADVVRLNNAAVSHRTSHEVAASSKIIHRNSSIKFFIAQSLYGRCEHLNLVSKWSSTYHWVVPTSTLFLSVVLRCFRYNLYIYVMQRFYTFAGD